jgi:hypothetical protein
MTSHAMFFDEARREAIQRPLAQDRLRRIEDVAPESPVQVHAAGMRGGEDLSHVLLIA